MSIRQASADNRAISEIYGTVLIIALAFITAIAVVGIGLFVLDDTTDDAGDRLAQDSVLELHDRLDQLSSDPVESSITWEAPPDTAENFEADGEEGEVVIEVRTNETYWEASHPDGALVEADDPQQETDPINLGAITHESGNGDLTVYQAGGVFSIQDNSATVLREPNIDATANTLDLNFIDISSLEVISEGDEITFRQEEAGTQAADIDELIETAMSNEEGDVVAPASVNVTVTGEFVDAWANFGEEGLDREGVEVWESDDLEALDSNQVKIHFGEYGIEDAINLPDPDDPYGDGVIYSGIAEFAHELYNDDEGTIEEGSFEVTDPDEYTVGIRYQHDDQEQNWWEYDDSNDRWINIENPNPDVEPLDTEDIDPVSDVSDDTFEIEAETWTCVVRGGELRPHVDGEGDGCLYDAVAVDNPGDSVAEFEPWLELTDLEIDGPADRELQFGEDALEVDVTVENTGTADATEEPVAVLTSLGTDWNNADPWVSAGDREEIPRGEEQSFEYTYEPSFVDEQFVMGAGTPDDNQQDPTVWEVTRIGDAEEFDIEGIDVLNDPIEEGETLRVDVALNNTGDNEDIQDLLLYDQQDRLQTSQEVTLAPDDGVVTRELQWDTEVGNNAPATDEIRVQTATDGDTADVTIQPAGEPVADFQIQDVAIDEPVEEQGDLEVEVDIENQGDTDGERTIRLRDDDDILRATVDDVEIDEGETVTLGDQEEPLVWETELGDAGVYDLTVETDDDTNTTNNVVIEPAAAGDTFEVTIDDDGINDPVIAGDPLEVPVEIEYNGPGTRTDNVWLENFDGEPVDSTTETLSSGDSTTETLVWETSPGDGSPSADEITANTPGDTDSALVEVQPEGADGPSYEITDVTTNSSTRADGSLPDDPTVEGNDLEIDVTVENTGEVLGTESIVVELVSEGRPIATKEVDVPGETEETYELTWETVIGDHTESPEDIRVEIGGSTATEEIYIDERQELRDPVDVMFVLDETGSMGTIQPEDENSFTRSQFEISDTWMLPTPMGEASGDNTGETYTVGEDIDFSSVVSENGEEFWLAVDNMNDPFSDVDLYGDGEEFFVWPTDTRDIWPGKQFTEEQSVPEEADLWYVVPESDGEVDGAVWNWQEVDGEYRQPDGDFYVSGQTIDPSDYGGEAYVFELSSSTCDSLCFDSEGVRYDAVQTALNQLDETIGDRAGLMEFDFEQNVYQSITGDIEQVRESLRINPSGATDITNAVREGQSRLNGLSEPNEKNMILLTDGEHNVGETDPDEIVGEIDDDVTVYVVGFGNADQQEIEPLADAGTGDGDAFFIEEDGDVEELTEIFEVIGEELDEPDLPEFQVETTDDRTVREGNTLEVPVGIENTGESGEQIITLTDIYGNVVDSEEVRLDAGEEIDVGDEDAPVLEWNAELEAGDEPPEDGEILVRSPDDQTQTDVTVTEGEPSNFVVDIDDDEIDPADPQATDEIEVTVDIENEQQGSDVQTVILRDYNGDPVDVVTVELDGVGEGDDETTETFTWQTTSRDAGDDRTITVESDDDADSQNIDIEEAPGADDEFLADIVDTNDPITAGEELEVDIEIENVGEDPGTQFVELRNFADNVVELQEVDLGTEEPDNTTTFEMTWLTSPGDGGTDDIRVTTRDDDATQEVEIENIEGTDSEFEIIDTEFEEAPIEAGEDIVLDAEIENTGSETDTKFVEATFAGVTDTVEILNLGPGDRTDVSFEFSTSVTQGGDTYEIPVETEDDEEIVEIEVQEAPGDQLDVAIDGTADPVQAGEELAVNVDVTGLEADSTVSLLTPYGGIFEPEDVEPVGEGDSSVTLIWDTRAGQGSDDPQEITVRIQDVTDSTTVVVDEAPEGDVDAPGTGPGSDPVGIDIEEIEAS